MFISQAARLLVANKEPGFFFYYNPRWFIERFLGRTAWLNEIPAEPARWTLMDEIFVKLSGLRAGVTQDIKVCGYNYRGHLPWSPIYREDLDCPRIFVGRGFHNFISALLICFIPLFEAATCVAFLTAIRRRTSCMGMVETRVRFCPG